jgi:hypothetical protein
MARFVRIRHALALEFQDLIELYSEVLEQRALQLCESLVLVITTKELHHRICFFQGIKLPGHIQKNVDE